MDALIEQLTSPIPSEALSGGKFPFSKVDALIEQLALPIQLDRSNINYEVGLDGSLIYLDKIKVRNNKWRTDELMDYMKENEYSERDRQIVTKSIERLQELDRPE